MTRPRSTAVCGFMGYSYLQKPHSERGREFKVSSICLRTAVSQDSSDGNQFIDLSGLSDGESKSET